MADEYEYIRPVCHVSNRGYGVGMNNGTLWTILLVLLIILVVVVLVSYV